MSMHISMGSEVGVTLLYEYNIFIFTFCMEVL